MILNDEEQSHLAGLRRREAMGTLTAAETEALQALHARLDAAEAVALQASVARMQQTQSDLRNESDRAASEAEELTRIVTEQEKLVAEAHAWLSQLRARRAALARDYQSVTGRELTTSR